MKKSIPFCHIKINHIFDYELFWTVLLINSAWSVHISLMIQKITFSVEKATYIMDRDKNVLMIGVFLTVIQLFWFRRRVDFLIWLKPCELLFCFYQLFGLILWRHPFTVEDPLINFNLLHLYSAFLGTQSGLHRGGGGSPQPSPVCSIHLDDATAVILHQNAHHTPANCWRRDRVMSQSVYEDD